LIDVKKFFKSIGRLLFTALLLASPQWADAKAKYSVIITTDGLRPDAISRSNVPNIKSLIKRGSYSLKALTVIPPATLPAHISLVTGLSPKGHEIELNFWMPLMDYVDRETIFEIAKKHGLKTSMFVGKDKLEYLAKPGSIDHFESTGRAPGSAEKIASSFSSYFSEEKPELTLIHFSEPDITGHSKGWMSEDYIKACEEVDRAIGTILESIRKIGTYDDTFIIITSDHGGRGKTHKGSHRHVMRIPWIAYGKDVKRGYKIKKKVRIYDTAPTVLFALGIKAPPTWDGKPVKEIFMKQKGLVQKE
jgi:predicted AlkP superfamily pyrophosphatase or phosphodiesterase